MLLDNRMELELLLDQFLDLSGQASQIQDKLEDILYVEQRRYRQMKKEHRSHSVIRSQEMNLSYMETAVTELEELQMYEFGEFPYLIRQILEPTAQDRKAALHGWMKTGSHQYVCKFMDMYQVPQYLFRGIKGSSDGFYIAEGVISALMLSEQYGIPTGENLGSFLEKDHTMLAKQFFDAKIETGMPGTKTYPSKEEAIHVLDQMSEKVPVGLWRDIVLLPEGHIAEKPVKEDPQLALEVFPIYSFLDKGMRMPNIEDYAMAIREKYKMAETEGLKTMLTDYTGVYKMDIKLNMLGFIKPMPRAGQKAS